MLKHEYTVVSGGKGVQEEVGRVQTYNGVVEVGIYIHTCWEE